MFFSRLNSLLGQSHWYHSYQWNFEVRF